MRVRCGCGSGQKSSKNDLFNFPGHAASSTAHGSTARFEAHWHRPATEGHALSSVRSSSLALVYCMAPYRSRVRISAAPGTSETTCTHWTQPATPPPQLDWPDACLLPPPKKIGRPPHSPGSGACTNGVKRHRELDSDDEAMNVSAALFGRFPPLGRKVISRINTEICTLET